MANRLKIHYAVDAYSMKHRRRQQQDIVTLLRKHGVVINEYCGASKLKRKHHINCQTKNGRMQCGNACLDACDVVVANCTARSHSVGRKIERAVWQGKQCIIIYDATIAEHPLSDFVDGDDQLWLVEYSTLAGLAKVLAMKFEAIRLIVPIDRKRREVKRKAAVA